MTGVMERDAESEAGLRERNKAEKKARIRDAAAALFRELGYGATTTQAVAERAGVAKGTIFLYAPTKPELVALVFEDRIRRTTAEAFASLPGSGSRSLADELDAVFARLFAMYAKEPELARIFVKELAFVEGPARRLREEIDGAFFAALAARIEARKARGEIGGDVPAMLAAANAFALYLMALMAWLSGALPSADAARAHLRASIDLQIRGLRPTDGDEGGETCQKAHRPTKERSGSARQGRATSKRGASGTAATKRRGSS